MTAQPRVVVLTRPGCHLCDAAVTIIVQVCAETGNGWIEQDITAEPDLLAKYTNEIPVTFVDGVQHDFWRVDAGRLRTALARG